MLSGSRFKEE